ncbi:MAG: hypothetical protein KGP01_02295 [Actinomycetales bacterium]|nr:hypothetical protein [Actinomycetales bacterium]
MRFFIAVIAKGDEPASADEMAAIDAFNDGLRRDGHWVYAMGIHGPSQSVVFDNRGGEGHVTEGPLHDLPEHMAGFWIIDAPDAETARRLASEGSLACNRKVELRPLHG